MPPLSFLVGAIAVMLVLLAGGVWIAFAVGISAVVALWPTIGVRTLTLIGLQSWDTTTSFVLVAIPLFVFMGEIISGAGLVTRLYSGVSRLIRGLPGDLVQTNLFACSIFAACSGSAVASAATMGRVSYGEQVVRRGYDTRLVLGSVAAGGTLGILIPPSIFFIVYASISDQSVGRLFLGGVVPGAIVSLAFMTYVALRCLLNPRLVPRAPDEGRLSLATRLAGLGEIWPFLLLIAAVLGSLYGGVATPTEAAGVGASAALLIAAGYRALTWSALQAACLGTVKTSCMLFFIIISAKIMALALALAYYGVPAVMRQFATSLGSPYLLLLLIAAIYLLLGTVFEDFSLMIIMLPFVLPMVQAAGFDLIWFGVFMTVLLEAGLLSPPVGLNLFVIQGVTGAPLAEVVWGSVPFLAILLAAGVLLALVPALALWLPSLVM